MYAIIESGGKQLKVSPGQVIRVEKLEAEPGDAVSFDRVMLVKTDDGLLVGTPTVLDVSVSGKVLEQGKGPKVLSFRFKRRKRVRVRKGHRQPFTAVKIESINL